MLDETERALDILLTGLGASERTRSADGRQDPLGSRRCQPPSG